MKSTKKLSLKKMDIAKLDTVKGGLLNLPIADRPSLPSMGCGPATQGLACQYSQTPLCY